MTIFFILNALLNLVWTTYAFYKNRERVTNYIKEINDDVETFSTSVVAMLFLILMTAPVTSTMFTVYMVIATIIECIRLK